MFRQRKRNDQKSEDSVNKFLQHMLADPEMTESVLDPTVKLAEELKAFFHSEIQVLGFDLKKLKQVLSFQSCLVK